jgi:hypothetical protein
VPVYPVLHVQAAITLLPTSDPVFNGQFVHTASDIAFTAVEYVCKRQLVQILGPVSTLYLPAEHPTHSTKPPPLVCPAVQMHAFSLALPTASVIVFATQVVQA